MIPVLLVSLAAALLSDAALAVPKLDSFGPMIARSPAMRRVFEVLRRVAQTDHPVLLLGETGVGKDLAAQGIHTASRRKGSFVALNMAAIPADLFESELFGHVRGAFTDAREERAGAFVEADHGTLFLDEVGDLPLDLQAKLLRALETGVVRPVGGSKAKKVHVRIVAATNVDLAEKVARGAFRADLFWRLSVLPIVIPPLRERPEDVEVVARYLLAELDPSFTLDREAVQTLERYAWPGNVRELRNVLVRALVMTGPKIRARDLVLAGETVVEVAPLKAPPPKRISSFPSAGDPERRRIVRALQVANGNLGFAAEKLGMARSTLRSRMAVYQVLPEEYAADPEFPPVERRRRGEEE